MKHNNISDSSTLLPSPLADDLPRPLASRTLFWRPRYLRPSLWAAQIPFAFWLIETCQPRCVVELGVGGGTSYFAFCQAVDKLGLATRCTGIDHGRGDGLPPVDAAARAADRAAVAAYNDAQYQEFSTLLEEDVVGAERHFPPGTIDLLHIDLELTAPVIDALLHDWAPRLSPRAVVLLHGFARQLGTPQVAAFVEKLRGRHDGFELAQGEGLLVALIGPEQPEKLRRLAMLEPGRAEHGMVREVFQRLGRGYQLDLEVRAAAREAEAQRAARAEAEAALTAARSAVAAGEEDRTTLRAALDARARSAAAAQAGLVDREREIEALEADRAELAARLEAAEADRTRLAAEARGDLTRGDLTEGDLARQLDRARKDLARARGEIDKLTAYGRSLEAKYAEILASETWRAMEPVRRLLRGLKRRPAPAPFAPRLSAKAATADPGRRAQERWREIEARRAAGRPALIAADATARSEKVTVFLATYPARKANLEPVVQALLPQCDLLNVYLNEYDTVPACLNSPKIRAVLGKDAAGDLKDNGKFFAAPDHPEGFHIFVDDDLLYPPDYVRRIVEGIRTFGYRAIVGFHGTSYEEPLASYIKHRSVQAYFREGPSVLVDQLGTGTTGYHTSTFLVDPAGFRTTGIADLWFARQAAERGVPLVTLERPAEWLRSMDEAGETLFRQAERDDTAQSELLRDELVPALRAGRVRPKTLNFLHSLYTPAHLARSGLNLERSAAGAFGAREPGGRRDIHFAVIINGWNCADLAGACLASLERQIPGDYSFEVHVYDDGSDDGTWRELEANAAFLNLRKFRGGRNMGPAFARDCLIRQVEDGTTICVLVDLDDALLPQALATLERTYRGNPDAWMTYGNWMSHTGRVNDEGFYAPEEIDSRAYRQSDVFKFTALRTFRRFLYDRVEEKHLKDQEGNWLRFCSDVGLMLPLVDQCASKNIVPLAEPIYLYNQHRPSGTQKRFGARKKATFRYLRDNEDLFRFATSASAGGPNAG